ncbi:unnamed protein product [Ascophyllum nodosum]
MTYAELMAEARQLASAISRAGIEKSDVVSVMVPNVPLGVTCHFAVPGMGATLHMINTRLDAKTVAFQLEHSESKLLIVDCELAGVAREALEIMRGRRPRLILAEDSTHPECKAGDGEEIREFLRTGNPDFVLSGPEDEDDAIALSYTSGTTGNPKGVVTHHRGAFLNAISMSLTWPMVGDRVVYLWTLPMFHCNGWCFPWTVTAAGGTHVCLRYVRAGEIFKAIARERVTHLCGAPVVMNLLLGATDEEKALVKDLLASKGGKSASAAPVQMLTGGSAPPGIRMRQMESDLGIKMLALYGLTEVYGPATACLWNDSWDSLDEADRDARMSWQVPSFVHNMYVAERGDLRAVPADGATLGEVLLRGNVVMTGYLKNDKATAEAFDGGEWFRTGDLAVQHPEGRVELKDRSKDIIISGGENISSIEVEMALHQHEAVLDVAVVAIPDSFWGEVPVAVVEAKPGAKVGRKGGYYSSKALFVDPLFVDPLFVHGEIQLVRRDRQNPTYPSISSAHAYAIVFYRKCKFSTPNPRQPMGLNLFACSRPLAIRSNQRQC